MTYVGRFIGAIPTDNNKVYRNWVLFQMGNTELFREPSVSYSWCSQIFAR